MLSRQRVAWLVIGFWSCFALFGAAQIYVSMLTHGHSFIRIVLYQLAVWSIWAAVTPVIALAGRRFPLIPPRVAPLAVHLVLAAVISVGHNLLWMALTMAMRPYDAMTAMEFRSYPEAMIARQPMELVLYMLVLAGAYAFDFYTTLRDREISLAEARLHALELQIQPHFLFNTLHAIGSLVRGRRQDEAVEMIAGLSDILRYSLDHAGNQRVPLDKELAMLERYLGIQSVRFADRLTVTIDVPPELRRARVPTLILQPLAENAIRHGIAQSAQAGRVAVSAARANGRLRIDVFNSGSLAAEHAKGIGLRNTEDRLRTLYGDDQEFSLRNTNGGVVASMTIPWSES